jgi:alpha-acetolactate decarboxylase
MLDPDLIRASHGHVHQLDVITDLIHGNYESITTVSEAFAHSHTGLGVADRLDGEIISIDGVTWRIPATGIPVIAGPDLGLPFAISAAGGTPLKQDLVAGMSESDIAIFIADLVKSTNDGRHSIAAVRVEGVFENVLLRSEHRQKPPFRHLDEVLRDEVQFPFDSWSGTLAGFMFPRNDVTSDESSEVIPGLHLHGISRDYTSGGHLHHATTIRVNIRIWLNDADVSIPHSRVSHAIDLLRHVIEWGTPAQRTQAEQLIAHLQSRQSTSADFTGAIALHDAYLHDPYLEK